MGRPNGWRQAWTLIAVAQGLVALLAACSGETKRDSSQADGSTQPSDVFAPVASQYDWQAQDYHDSQAITDVAYDAERQCLKALGDFVGGHPNKTNGEVYLDLHFVPQLEGVAPLGLSRTTVTAEVQLPAGFHHRRAWPERPNGVQLFFKDSQWRCEYGSWNNTQLDHGAAQTYRISHTFGRSKPAYSEKGFDPSKIMVLGVKFGIGTGSDHAYRGPLLVKNIEFSPAVHVAARTASAQEPGPRLFSPEDRVTVSGGAILLNSKPWFVVGANWRGLEYAQNFGSTAWWPWGNGVTRHVGYFQHYLELAQSAGLKALRIGLGKDGRVLLSPDGRVVGYDDRFRADVRKLLDLAAAHDIRVEFTLVDFLIAGKGEVVNGVQVRGHGHIFSDDKVREGFMRDFLQPLLKDFAGHPAWYATDVINEPEWIVAKKDGGGWEDTADDNLRAPQPVPVADLHSFVNQCIRLIKSHNPHMPVTVGVSTKFAGLVSGLPIDYYALHHYPHFGELEPYVKRLPAGKPWVLEEYPTRQTTMGPAEHLNLVQRLGGSGALLWNLRPGSDDRTYTLDERDMKLAEIRAWAMKHPPVVPTNHKERK